MSTITLPNIRVSSDLEIRLKLKDGGVAIDWTTLSNIKATIYSDRQRSLAGRCDIAIDEEDSTILVCRYSANKPQYPGVNRVIVSCTYDGETKTYDKPALNFVRWTDDQAGQQITIDDPDIDVEISVEDVSSSILQEAVEAAFSAAERADEAAAAAEHMVDIHTGPAGKSAYEVAVEEGYTGTEEEWLASLEGPVGATPDISIGTVTTVEPGTPAAATMTGTPAAPVLNLTIPKGVAGDTPAFTVGEVTTGQPGTPVVVTITGTAAAPVLNVTIPQGLQGNPGSSVDYPFELVNNATTNDATKAATAAVAKGLKDDITQLEAIVTNLAGKFYGVFDDDSDLPEGDIVGYAFVGTAEPLALFTFDGENWTDTEVAISGIIGPPGPQGIQGIQGIQGPPGVTGAEATIDAGTGTPSVEVTLTNGVLTFAFHNLKGLQGNTGSSVSYPFTLVNNTTTDDATQALTAAMGKMLQDQIDAFVVDNDFEEEDLTITDENGFAIASFRDGEFRTKNFDSSKVKVESGETSEDDFDIRDENDYAIVQFNGGHIKTKNFDSSLVGRSHWYGKSWYGFGTSITDTSTVGKYPPYLAQISGLVFTNHGNGGSGITSFSDEELYDDIMTADLSGADLITLEVGANDGQAPLGTIYDGLPDSEVQDNSTFCGALNLCIRRLQEDSNAQIVVMCSPSSRYQRTDPTNIYDGNETSGPDNHTIFDRNEAIRKVCMLNSCWFIPAGAMDGFGYARMNASNDLNTDNVHHTNLGGYNFAQAIWAFLKNIPLFYTSI